MSTPQTAAERAAPISDAWYPPPDVFWVSVDQETERPFRYGDLFAAPTTSASGQSLTTVDGRPWHGVMVLSPRCEVISKVKDTTAIEVARVLPLGAQDPGAARAIVAGWQERTG